MKIILILLLYTVIGCDFNQADSKKYEREEAEKVTKAFYRDALFNNYARIDTLFSPVEYSLKRKNKVKIEIQKLHEQFGTIVTWDLKDSNTIAVKGLEYNTQYVFKYDVDFASKKLIETFYIRKENGIFRIYDLQVEEIY